MLLYLLNILYNTFVLKELQADTPNGRVAELVDALDSKSCEGNLVRVRFPPRPPKKHFICEVFFYGWARKQLNCFSCVGIEQPERCVAVLATPRGGPDSELQRNSTGGSNSLLASLPGNTALLIDLYARSCTHSFLIMPCMRASTYLCQAPTSC